ncbi:ArsA-related P-loop ATPase [Conexibacter stalactiti]|uniref:ArsA-related P-loop ATPase n=1 Tax=Conexibacter stalactiti TaxID=1940611 RepID=A0ABU4HVD6_9ACTN|nr:ArsA-related P-loop ATPase [Conexibacter stalactiti]MDW5597286.1 ArsA-related P-loop ATPase [Conexibacter stalactiti]MEC5037928.1 ArsA-related P-loop ATPase [Conexibacter stalactiti]
MSGLSDKRLLFLTGKGGVGKSTVAIALALAAARRGRRTVIAELTGQDRAAVAFGHADGSSGARELRLAENLFTISIEPQHVLEEYLQQKAGPLGDVLAGSRTFHGFVSATPGMRELLALGKVWELAQPQRRTRDAQPYDLVVVDAPATGHGLATLLTPRTFAEIAKVGPIASQGRTLDAFFTDARLAAVVAVALAEEMPVNETISLRERLREEAGIELAATVVNALVPDRLGPRQAATVAGAVDGVRSPLVRAALESARSEHVRARAQRAQVERLAEGLGSAPFELPYLFTPAVDMAGLELLSERLEELL